MVLGIGALLGLGPAAAQGTIQGTAAVPVQAVALQPVVWRTHIAVAASLQARQTADLGPARSGIAAAVLFQSGQPVAAGALLVQLENGPEAAQLALDQARLTQAQRDYARTQKLMSISGSSESALEQAAAAAEEASAQVRLDQANLAQLQITAPFPGTVGIRSIDPGDYLNAGQPVVTLTGPGALRVLFSIPQTEAGNLAPGNPFSLSAPTSDGGAITAAGIVTALSPAQTARTNAREVEGRVTSDSPLLLPGMAAAVDIATGAPVPAFAVPSTAINDSTLGPYLFVITPNAHGAALTTVYVTIYGTRGSTTVISTAGLKPSEQAVALGGFKLTDGASVTVQSP